MGFYVGIVNVQRGQFLAENWKYRPPDASELLQIYHLLGWEPTEDVLLSSCEHYHRFNIETYDWDHILNIWEQDPFDEISEEKVPRNNFYISPVDFYGFHYTDWPYDHAPAWDRHKTKCTVCNIAPLNQAQLFDLKPEVHIYRGEVPTYQEFEWGNLESKDVRFLVHPNQRIVQ